ncbi:uncharacterized protein I206_103428 [Kwoniella pini CBS 10737]|uniref:Trafficking protein particle complex subunit 11 domain-containing protein n=1 Tax=Kwoniella pini CBS 10737 TaxID=1296096 RepID=A0A1B9IA38_9TREE|nr:uncharacterized protein I206_01568 [Kwoniella pini CBS 10737]OCF52281.1 hypothetical protein I206_01568 [Kwoniella pini CBS 10737]
MNSYPNEFLAHPQPLMFVAGLNSITRDRSTSTASTSSQTTRRPSGGAANLIPPTSGDIALTTPITSPTPQLDNLPKLNEGNDEDVTQEKTKESQGEVTSKDIELDERDKEFEELVYNLRSALTPLGGKGKVWLGEESRKDFRIILVDKGVRLPMRKINPSSSINSQSQQSISDLPINPHSPLSPLIPSSPLYPDGLIAPVWIRKHAELVPSVFVLFLRLYESKPLPEGDEPEVQQAKEAANKAMEKDQDDQLIREIGDRRRRLGERGIKLTVVLMASAATLDSPTLDPRLSYLRRASALSAKASLFVLTPVPADQLPDFVQSLQDALYDSAVEYYSNHAKRVKRKRSRLPLSQNILSPSITGQGSGGSVPKALSPQGWAVRYDWKAGWFAEVRGEFDVARRHYEDCWNELAKMFASTTTLPPRTKRWAEAKVLADCVAIRICKLLLYDDQGPRVLNPFFVHLKRFGDLSRGWGIGEETFEFWSWIARQYRIFAELLELAQQSGLRIASLAPPLFPTAQAASVPPQPLDHYATPISSGNPLQVLQQPAFYYYTAASCSIQRQVRYQEALAVETDALNSEAGSVSGYVSTAPGFANEKKVDHAALVIELFTKAYSLLKEQDHAQNRMALFVAFRIAEVYCQSAQYEMAIRFFDRISHGFKRERWSPIVKQIRRLWYECAQQTGNVESAARLLVEMMSPDSGVEGEERAALQGDLLSLLTTTSPASSEPIVVEFDGQSSLLNVQAGFWQAESTVSKSIPYQIVMRCPDNVNVGDIDFTSLRISWSDEREDTIISHSESAGEVHESVRVEEGEEAKASLNWIEGRVLVIDGSIQGETEGDVTISKIKLLLKKGPWDLEIYLNPNQLAEWHTPKGTVTPIQELSSSVSFMHQPHNLDLQIDHVPSAFVGEDVEVIVKATNQDDREMDVTLSVFLQSGEGDEDEGSTLTIQDDTSSSLLKDVSLGAVAPGSTISKIITLRSAVESTKILDISILSSIKMSQMSSSSNTDDIRTEELIRTAVIPILRPFEVKMGIKYSERLEDSQNVEAIVGILVEVPGPREIEVEKIELIQGDQADIQLVSDSLNSSNGFTQNWDINTSYAISAKFIVQPGAGFEDVSKIPANLIFTWKSNKNSLKLIKTIHSIPKLIYPTPKDSFILPIIHLPKPPIIFQNKPFIINLSIINTNKNFNFNSSSSNNKLQIICETLEGFIWLGSKNILINIKNELKYLKEFKLQFKFIYIGNENENENLIKEKFINLPKILIYQFDEEDDNDNDNDNYNGKELIEIKGNYKILVKP